MKTQIAINEIKKNTEKAILVSVAVSWNGNVHVREFWMPKKLVNVLREDLIEVEDWFIAKLEKENTFNGYIMNFEGRF